MDDQVLMLKGLNIRLEYKEPGDSAVKAGLLERWVFGTAYVKGFLDRLEVGKPALDSCYDPQFRAVILMRALPISGHMVVMVRGFKNVSREQYAKFLSETDLSIAPTGDTAVQLEVARILGVSFLG
jgi:hypothetical protein